MCRFASEKLGTFPALFLCGHEWYGEIKRGSKEKDLPSSLKSHLTKKHTHTHKTKQKQTMSGYRALHRHTETPTGTTTTTTSEQEAAPTSYQPCPVFAVQFSPCNQTHHTQRSATAATTAPPSRILASSADGFIRCYKITDKSAKADVLDASALSMTLDQVMLQSSNDVYPKSMEECQISLGSTALSVIRNYLGEDPNAGGEITASMRLDGHVSILKREEQPVYSEGDADADVDADVGMQGDCEVEVVIPDIEFHVKGATGTTMMLLPPQLTGFSRHGIVMMVGMLDGSVSFICSGVGIPDSRKGNDASKFSEQGLVLDSVGSGNSIPLSLAVHPRHHLTFAVGRKDGTIDLYSSGDDACNDDVYGQFRRCHRLTQHAGSPVRALCYTPDGSLLISACDDGHIYIHDMSSFHKNESIRLVAAIHNAHKGYVLSIDVLPDSKRFITSSADRTVKVWNVGTPNVGPVHTFEAGNQSMIWDVSCSLDGRRCVSCSDDGCVQIYSCDE
jgi:WD40 repeat protein